MTVSDIKVDIFPTIRNEETYVEGAVQRNRIFSRLSQISPGPKYNIRHLKYLTNMRVFVKSQPHVNLL